MMHFQLVSAKGVKFDGEAYEVIVPTKAGTVAIFLDHMPLISAASPGVVSIRKKEGDRDDAMEHFAVTGGALQVDGKAVRFLSDDVTSPDEVSEQAAEAALARAQELMAKAKDQVALHEATRLLHHSSAQLHIAKLKKRHHN
jgi:F-type H+-transporting ATPase subunit epsilon